MRFRYTVNKNFKRNFKIISEFQLKPVSEEFVKDCAKDFSSNEAFVREMRTRITPNTDTLRSAHDLTFEN